MRITTSGARGALVAVGALGVLLLSSCATVVPVARGQGLRPDAGYVAIMFTNQRSFIAIGAPSVYVVLDGLDSGMTAYVPFGTDGELRVIQVTPGRYRIDGFVSVTGMSSTGGDGPAQSGVLTSPPVRPGNQLVDATFPPSYRAEFTVHADELAFLGAYSWKNAIFSLTPGVTVERGAASKDEVLTALRRDHPSTPPDLRFVSIVK